MTVVFGVAGAGVSVSGGGCVGVTSRLVSHWTGSVWAVAGAASKDAARRQAAEFMVTRKWLRDFGGRLLLRVVIWYVHWRMFLAWERVNSIGIWSMAAKVSRLCFLPGPL